MPRTITSCKYISTKITNTCQEQTLQNMVKSEYFPDIEDSAMPEGNMSAISGLREAVIEQILPLSILPPGNKSEKLRGTGQSPVTANPEGVRHT